MKAINPYLNFDGNCGDAMKFYAKALGGELQMQTYKDAGMETAPGGENRVLHARLEGGSPAAIIMASDAPPDQPTKFGTNLWLTVDCSDTAEQDRMFKAFSVGGQVVMPLADQFWGARFGMIKDKFGVGWMFNCEVKK